MEIASPVAEASHRLGLELDLDGGASSSVAVSRSGWTISLDAADLFAVDGERDEHLRAAWLLLGVRFGIDKLAASRDDEQRPHSPRSFRRTSLRRYHEAPSVHGDHLQLLVPELTRRTFEAIADAAAFRREWITEELEILVVRETGKRLDILTDDAQGRSEMSDELRWEKTRSALFYQSYKIRPRETREVSGGRLRFVETGEGFGASRALLLPEFDYDASRDYGYLGVPTRDRIIIARPQDRDEAPSMLPALREALRDSMEASNFALTDAVVQLEPESVRLLDEPTLALDVAPSPAQRLLSISPP